MRKLALNWKVLAVLCVIILLSASYTIWQQTQNNSPVTERPVDQCLSITDFAEKSSCASNIYGKLVASRPATEILSEIQQLQQEGLLADCHEVSHAVGKALLTKYNGNVGDAFVDCNHNCIDGCFHGIMESRVQTSLQDTGELKEFLTESCKHFPNASLHWQCSHGLGHGLTGHGNLKLEQALDACFILSDPNVPGACVSGVLMEYIDLFLRIPNQNLTTTIPIICDEPKKIDKKNKPGLATECTSGIGQNLMMFTGYNLNAVVPLCNSLPKDEADICLWSADLEYQDHLRDLEKLR